MSRNTYKPMTEAQRSRIAYLVREGLKLREIADLMRMSYGRVVQGAKLKGNTNDSPRKN